MTDPARAAKATGDARAERKRRPTVARRPVAPAGLDDLQQSAGNAAVNALLTGRVRPGGTQGGSPTRSAVAAVQRAPDPLQAFVEQWFKQHVVVGNTEFTAIAALPEDQRRAVLAEVRRRYGDEYIRRGQAGQLTGQPTGPKATDPVNAEDYWKKHGKAHLDAALERTVAKVDFQISGPGLRFDPGECSAFTHFALAGRMQRLEATDVSQLLDTPVPQLVDSVRVLDDLDRGADAYEPAVTERIVERLGLGLRQATSRLALPYALARAKAVADARATNPLGPALPGPVADPDPDAAARAQPLSLSLGATTTIEHGVAEALVSGTFVEFDEAAFGMLYVPQLVAAPRPVELDFERGSGDWKTVRVTKPADARPVDVANELFGSPEMAHLVAGWGSSFSFAFPPSRLLAEPYDSMWREHIEQDEGGGVLDLIRGRAPSDPLLGLDEEHAELRALDTAAAHPADGDQAAVVQRLEIIQAHLTAIATAAGPLGVADFVAPVLARIKTRMAACAADNAEAQKWSAHSATQISVLSEVKTGFDAITQQMFATGLPAVSTSDGEQLVGDVTGSMQGPTVEITNAYASVVSASDQLDVAQQRLVTAKQRMAAYPFDMADRMLALIRKRIAVVDDYATVPMQSYSRERLDALQAEISGQVAELRLAVVNGDGTAVNRLSELKTQLAMLDLQSTVGSMISTIHDLKGTLFASESWSPDTERESEIYDQLHAAIQPWSVLAGDYEQLWRAGKERDEKSMADIRRRVEALRQQTQLPTLIQAVASFQTDEAERQRMIAIGVMIAAALLAAVTGGLASGAIGGVAGAVVGAGLEALTFTAITGTLNTDQTFGGFMAELGINFATFGGLRAISGGAKLLAGGKLTLAQKAAEMTVEGLWMVAATKANEEIQARLSKGEKMTTQTASTIFGHQMLISFASRVIGRGANALVAGRAEINKLKEVQLYLAKQGEAEAVAQKFLDKGDDSLGAALVRADTESIRAEVTARQKIHEIASNPAEAKKHNLELTTGELATLAAATKTASRELTEREINALMQKVETQADHVIAEPAVYADLLAKHRQQGSGVVEGFDAAGSPTAKITPQAVDGSFGTPFTMHSRLGPEVESILATKGLPPSAVVGDYLAKRAADRAGALADLRTVSSAAELDALMEKTLGQAAVTARVRAVKLAASERLVDDVFGSTVKPSTAHELARVDRIDRPLLEQLKARGAPVVDSIGDALVKMASWPENAKAGLVKLAAHTGADATRILPKVMANLEIEGMNAWVTLASRQLNQPARLLDLEASLNKAIQLRGFATDLAVEVDYYKGKRITREERIREQADKAKFVKEQHKNIDVETSTERWELKRVNPEITTPDLFLSQIKEGVGKYTAIGIPSAAKGGGKLNFVDVEYGAQITIPGFDTAAMRATIEQYIARNPGARKTVDAIIIHIDLPSGPFELRVDVR